MTYRERREARAARRDSWAEGREAKSETSFAKVHQILDSIPMGQPILVDHYSAKRHRKDIERMDSAMGAAVEHSKMAEHHASKAEGIRDQLERSIYSDDHDAIEKLEERIAALEAERTAIRVFNAAVRKAKGDQPTIVALVLALPEDLRRGWESHNRIYPGAWQFPSYASSNLSGNIKRNRDRLTLLQARKAASQ